MDGYLLSLIVCGIVVQSVAGYYLGRFFFKGMWAALAAGSVCRWGYNVGKVHGFSKSSWTWMPRLFWEEWKDFLCSPYGSITQSHVHGSWSGIGRWRVYPKGEEWPRR